MAGQIAIETLALTKIFTDWWGRSKVMAVSDLSLQVRHNEVFGFLGPNGSGKTTTIKMLLGLLKATKGRSLVLGGESTDPKIASRIGYLPEESYLYKYLSARETLNFYANLFGLAGDVRKMRVEALLDMVGLGAVANRPVGTFSKGMARRIGLAQALINDPDLLILDEPTSGLDPIGTRQIKDLIIALAKRGKTILLCSHLLADVEDVCDRIAILYGGKMQTQGKVKELLEQHGKIQITTKEMPAGVVSQIKDIIEKQGGQFQVSPPLDRLETFFMRIVEQAQAQNQSTSGAMNTGQVEQYLNLTSKPSSILDKLVENNEAPVVNREPIVTEKVETAKIEPDRVVLKELISNAQPPKTEAIKPQEKVKVEIPKPAVNRNVLDDLVDPSNAGDK
ncbi:MAG: hypothetical protein A2Y07_09725 [Planctomycetes bacterium GWF2_50_10]|nr:MAG: hypothetical protein A2Y07_09725 [Planctomycetes bacterium GWF2_50_10]